ncbi:MAG: thioredoxin fold domain-containing protein [Gammaproteobacteria bacterium]|nr:thioredoxin fold domain-containing protein [Gammaproteobacteria bacterium]
MTRIFTAVTLFFLSLFTLAAFAAEDIFSDQTLTEKIILPDWFKLSFLDLQDDLDEAAANQKKGIIIYFGRKDCPYCKALLENNWGREDIVRYTNNHFDVIAIDTKGTKNITDFDGYVFDEKQFSLKMKTNFTPSLLFYNLSGALVLRLSGYQQPYRFLAALEYVAGNHYEKRSFKSYLSLASSSHRINDSEELNFEPFFDLPPHNLNRKLFAAERPLAVFFENKSCHACDILHSVPLEQASIRKKLGEMDVIQLDIMTDQQIITPDGSKTSLKNWAQTLNIHYTPTIIFFDEAGNEIIRIDSVVWVNRLGRVLDYVRTRAYKTSPSFLQWRSIVTSP